MENLDIVSLLVRLVAGTLFFWQGYDKLFKIKIENVVRTFSDSMKGSFIPFSLLKPLITISSIIELVGGILLWFGLFKYYTLSILSIDLVFVAFSFSSIKAMWDMQFYYPRFIMILILWAIPFSNDIYCIDYFLKVK